MVILLCCQMSTCFVVRSRPVPSASMWCMQNPAYKNTFMLSEAQLALSRVTQMGCAATRFLRISDSLSASRAQMPAIAFDYTVQQRVTFKAHLVVLRNEMIQACIGLSYEGAGLRIIHPIDACQGCLQKFKLALSVSSKPHADVLQVRRSCTWLRSVKAL